MMCREILDLRVKLQCHDRKDEAENIRLNIENTQLKAELALERSRNAFQGPANDDLLEIRSNEARLRGDSAQPPTLKAPGIKTNQSDGLTTPFHTWTLRVNVLNAEFNTELIKTLRQNNHELKANEATYTRTATESRKLKIEVSKLTAKLCGFTSI